MSLRCRISVDPPSTCHSDGKQDVTDNGRSDRYSFKLTCSGPHELGGFGSNESAPQLGMDRLKLNGVSGPACPVAFEMPKFVEFYVYPAWPRRFVPFSPAASHNHLHCDVQIQRFPSAKSHGP